MKSLWLAVKLPIKIKEQFDEQIDIAADYIKLLHAAEKLQEEIFCDTQRH